MRGQTCPLPVAQRGQRSLRSILGQRAIVHNGSPHCGVGTSGRHRAGSTARDHAIGQPTPLSLEVTSSNDARNIQKHKFREFRRSVSWRTVRKAIISSKLSLLSARFRDFAAISVILLSLPSGTHSRHHRLERRADLGMRLPRSGARQAMRLLST